MKELNNEIEINASAERVWNLLTDFANFSQWNPFIQRVTGTLTVGEQLRVTDQPSGTQSSVSHPTVMIAEQNHELRWRKQLLFPGLLDAEHIFTITAIAADRVRFIQREIFTGLLSSLPADRRNIDRRRGFREMNQALKKRAEQPRSAD